MYKRIIAFILILCLFPIGAFAKTQAIIKSNTRVYKSATTRSISVPIKKNTMVYLIEKKSIWSKIENPSNNTIGYIKTKYLKIQTAETTTKADKVIKQAKSLLGKPYKQNGKGPKYFDCSNFIAYCFKKAGISLSGNLKKLSKTSKATRIASLNNCQPGDILFFSNEAGETKVTHCSIYVNNNQIIHASATAKKVILSEITDYYKRTFLYALRPKGL